MKTKTILLSALFVGAFTIQNASADCPAHITGREYKTLKDGGNIYGYVFSHEIRTFDMSPEEVVYFNAVDSWGDRFCGYTYHDMIGQEPSFLTIKLKGVKFPKKNKK